MRGRSRTIKPELFADEVLGDLELSTGLPIFRVFVGLICHADREGRFEWLPRALRGAIHPCWDGDMAAALEALASRSYIVRYTVNGKDYGFVRNFQKHQTIHPREAASVLPAPAAHGVTTPPCLFQETPGSVRDASQPRVDRLEAVSLSEVEVGSGSEGTAPPPAELLPHEKAELRQLRERDAALAASTLKPPMHEFPSEWKPSLDDRAFGLELGLTEQQMRDRIQECRLKYYPHPFTNCSKQFRRELRWLKVDLQKPERKANPHGLDENPGRSRRAGDPRPAPAFGRRAG